MMTVLRPRVTIVPRAQQWSNAVELGKCKMHSWAGNVSEIRQKERNNSFERIGWDVGVPVCPSVCLQIKTCLGDVVIS